MAINIAINTQSPENETELIRAFTAHHGYTDTVMDAGGNQIPNPLTRLQFLRQTVRRQIKEAAMAQKRSEAMAAAVLQLPDIDVT